MMDFKFIIELLFAVTVFFLIVVSYTMILLNAAVELLIEKWFKERESYVKRISSLSDIEKEFEHTNVN